VVTPTWLLLALLVTLGGPSVIRDNIRVGTAGSYVVALALVILVYGAVLLHEAAHVLVARALGLRVGRVVLQLLGAQSEVLDEPPTPDPRLETQEGLVDYMTEVLMTTGRNEEEARRTAETLVGAASS